jgi:hypothetical protein
VELVVAVVVTVKVLVLESLELPIQVVAVVVLNSLLVMQVVRV